MNLENIPEYLKENASWCLWEYETRNNKETKIPINPITECYASTNNPKTFTSYEKASSKLNSYDGLGVKVDGNLVAIDLDDCVIDGVLNDLAKEKVSHFTQSYIEFSPSGKGLRIFALLSKSLRYNKDLYKMKSREVEVYVGGFTSRFVTVTGDVYQEGEIVDEQDGLRWFLEKYLKIESKKVNVIHIKLRIFKLKRSL